MNCMFITKICPTFLNVKWFKTTLEGFLPVRLYVRLYLNYICVATLSRKILKYDCPKMGFFSSKLFLPSPSGAFYDQHQL